MDLRGLLFCLLSVFLVTSDVLPARNMDARDLVLVSSMDVRDADRPVFKLPGADWISNGPQALWDAWSEDLDLIALCCLVAVFLETMGLGKVLLELDELRDRCKMAEESNTQLVSKLQRTTDSFEQERTVSARWEDRAGQLQQRVADLEQHCSNFEVWARQGLGELAMAKQNNQILADTLNSSRAENSAIKQQAFQWLSDAGTQVETLKQELASRTEELSRLQSLLNDASELRPLCGERHCESQETPGSWIVSPTELSAPAQEMPNQIAELKDDISTIKKMVETIIPANDQTGNVPRVIEVRIVELEEDLREAVRAKDRATDNLELMTELYEQAAQEVSRLKLELSEKMVRETADKGLRQQVAALKAEIKRLRANHSQQYDHMTRREVDLSQLLVRSERQAYEAQASFWQAVQDNKALNLELGQLRAWLTRLGGSRPMQKRSRGVQTSDPYRAPPPRREYRKKAVTPWLETIAE